MVVTSFSILSVYISSYTYTNYMTLNNPTTNTVSYNNPRNK